VDGFQGGEREVVLLSLVRSNARHEVGFVKDERRLNVAVTRSRRHCALFGDSDTFSTTASVNGLMTYIGEHAVSRCALELLEVDALPSATRTNMSVTDLPVEPEAPMQVETDQSAASVKQQDRNLASSMLPAEEDKQTVEEVEVVPKIDILASVADLSQGSAYLVHRPPSIIVNVKVKYKDRIGSIR
jgi:hypothetical protein